MSETAPTNIRRFEVLASTATVVGLIHQFATTEAGIADGLFSMAIMLALILLISRGRKNWARWVLLAMFVLGTAFMLWNASMVLNIGYPVVTLAVSILQAVALSLLFTKQSSEWLRRQQSA